MPPGINDNVHAPPTPPPEKYGEVPYHYQGVKKMQTYYPGQKLLWVAKLTGNPYISVSVVTDNGKSVTVDADGFPDSLKRHLLLKSVLRTP